MNSYSYKYFCSKTAKKKQTCKNIKNDQFRQQDFHVPGLTSLTRFLLFGIKAIIIKTTIKIKMMGKIA